MQNYTVSKRKNGYMLTIWDGNNIVAEIPTTSEQQAHKIAAIEYPDVLTPAEYEAAAQADYDSAEGRAYRKQASKGRTNLRFFAGQSAAGSESSFGFANDWDVFVFTSKVDRDRFVKESRNLSCIAIAKKDVTKHAANFSLTQNCYIKPKPFSCEYWGIADWWLPDFAEQYGIIGTVEVCTWDDNCERLFK